MRPGCLVAKCFNGNNGGQKKPRTTSKCGQHRMRRRAGLGGPFWLLQQGGAFLVVTGTAIGLSQLQLQPPKSGGEHIVPDGFSTSIRPSAAVAGLVEAIWDWDIPDGDVATAFTIKVPPSTAPYFVVQYRTLTHCRWQLGGDSYDHKNYGHVLTQTQSGTFAIRPRGPLGVITVRLKPEAASRLARASMHELMTFKIRLRNIFKDHDIALLEERVMESGSSSEPIACVENVLLQNLRQDREDPIFSHASSWLRGNLGLRL